MSRLHLWLLAVAVFPVMLLCASSPVAAGTAVSGADQNTQEKTDKVQWVSYEKGLDLAKSMHKKIYLLFVTDRCRFCRMMDSETFSNSKVAKILNENFIPIRVNSDDNNKLANDYMVRGVPTAWFLEDDGSRIGSRVGYVPPESFLNLLDFVMREGYR